jgi:CRISPR-associated protein Cmr2
MALAGQLDAWLESGGLTEGLEEAARLLGGKPDPVILPRKLVLKHGKTQSQALKDARLIPALLDAAAESDDERGAVRVREAVRKTLATAAAPEKRKAFRLETYYGLLMMDGDKMGRILSGDFDEKEFKNSDKKPPVITYRESFHEQVRKGFDEKAKRDSSGLLTRYGQQPRAVSPDRHLAISAALNDFSQHVVRHVVEEEHLGRLIYAGGDDVLAVLPVTDLLVCSVRLRHAYSGTLPEDETKDWGDLAKERKALHCKNGFAWLGGHLMRMMGKNATASAGLVVAHHQSPLGMVLRELRATEQRAKTEGGRDAVSITVIKRSGGSLSITLGWSDVKLLEAVIAFLRSEGTSRRAVYHSLTWLDDLPDPEIAPDMLEGLLGYQFARQSRDDVRARPLARTLVQWACVERGQPLAGKRIKDRLTAMLSVAEFLAREVRSLDAHTHSRNQADGAAA